MIRISGIDVDGHGEAEADEHARRVVLDRCVDEPLETGELDDLVEAPVDVLLRQPEDRAVQVDVLAPRQLGVEPRSELEQRRDPAVDRDRALVRAKDPRQALQQGALAGAVLADDGEDLALVDLERDPLERPELLVRRPAAAQDRGLQVLVALVEDPEPLPDVVDHDDGIGWHSNSLVFACGVTSCPRGAGRSTSQRIPTALYRHGAFASARRKTSSRRLEFGCSWLRRARDTRFGTGSSVDAPECHESGTTGMHRRSHADDLNP